MRTRIIAGDYSRFLLVDNEGSVVIDQFWQLPTAR